MVVFLFANTMQKGKQKTEGSLKIKTGEFHANRIGLYGI